MELRVIMPRPKYFNRICKRALLSAVIWLAGVFSFRAAAAESEFATAAAPLLKTYCFDCHSNQHAEAHVNLERLAADTSSFATDFKTWRTAVRMLDQNRMPPAEATKPDAKERRRLLEGIRRRLDQTAREHADDPGEVPLRRLTSAEYDYTFGDLTGLDLKLQNQLAGDAVGGEGFSNVGLVQFLQDSTLEQYLAAGKTVASHAVVGAGPLGFYETPGKTGLELSAISRIQDIYRQHGFRTAAGEGGEAFGLDHYPRAFFACWRYKSRKELGREDATFKTVAVEEGLDVRFVEHIWSVLTMDSPAFPTSEIVSRWQKLPAPVSQGDKEQTEIRGRCRAIHQVMLDWQTRFGKNPDAKEEAPLLAEDMFHVSRFQPFDMNINWPKGTTAAHLQMSIDLANREGEANAVVIWKKPRIQFRMTDGKLGPFRPLREILPAGEAQKLKFGRHPNRAKIGQDDFVTTSAKSPVMEIPIPDGARIGRLLVEAELDVTHGEDCIVRCSIAQEEDTDQGKSVSGLLANPDHPDFDKWKAGVVEFARLLPQVSHREPAPSDRDPIPPPFDGSYNNAERNLFHTKIKYYRDDGFLVRHILDDATRSRLDQAWIDLLGSFDFYEANLRFVAKKYQFDLAGRSIHDLDESWIGQLPAEPRPFVRRLHESFQKSQDAFRTAEPGHVEDALKFARFAWRRPLSIQETQRLREYYQRLRTERRLDHASAIRVLLTRILMAPEFLYRTEKPPAGEVVPLSQRELASRLSYFLWSSVPDAELNRAAEARELADQKQLAKQARRMLQDPKARRLAAEFFGQWFGFYRFDQYRGIDPKRFPEFDDGLKTALHEEAVSFFEHIVREDRPVKDILFADYVFLNGELAKHYGIDQTAADNAESFQRFENAGRFHRGGLFGLGAVHAVTSAPLRTSPVKRGDWVLRRVLGTPVPPPPPDAGSIPADDVLGDGKTVRERLESHRRGVSCRNCHARIDPLGFALEQFDPIGRWRDKYRDGQAIDTTGVLSDGSTITGLDDLKSYLKTHRDLFERTLCIKLAGYALGRSESIADVYLIDQMLAGLETDDRFSTLVGKIVTSPQFRYQRGRDFKTMIDKQLKRSGGTP